MIYPKQYKVKVAFGYGIGKVAYPGDVITLTQDEIELCGIAPDSVEELRETKEVKPGAYETKDIE